MSNLQTCWRQTVCQNRLRTASPQGIDAQASQGSVAPLTEQSDETFPVWQFFLLTENEAPQDALLSIESIEVRPLVPKGILSVRQTESFRCLSIYIKPLFFASSINIG